MQVLQVVASISKSTFRSYPIPFPETDQQTRIKLGIVTTSKNDLHESSRVFTKRLPLLANQDAELATFPLARTR